MIILSNVILIFVNLVHFWKHLKCSRLKCRRGCFNGSNDEFGEYPVVFYVYVTFQLLLSIFITLIYIYDLIYYQNTVIYQYDGHNSWNSINLIPQILLYPLGKKEEFTYFIKPTALTLTDNPIHNVSSIQDTNILFAVNLCILFVIYSIEAFMHWYRYYTVYVAHKYLKNFSFCHILKYYTIYILILILIIGISLFLQNYVGILIIILHLSFSIYCSNEQIKILYKSTNESFDKQHVKLMMAPLYPTRTYAILSSISSSIFLFILIASNTFNSIIYYPIFSCLTTLFLSLIFVRNRHFICKCCKKKDEYHENTGYYDAKNGKNTKHKSSKRCCLCFKKTGSINNDKKGSKPEIQYTATPVVDAGNDIVLNLDKLEAIQSGSSGDTEHRDNDGNYGSDEDVVNDNNVCIELQQQQSLNTPQIIASEQTPSDPKSETVSSPKPKHSLRELPDGFHIVSPSGLVEMEQIVDNLQDDDIENIQQPQHSRKGTKHHIDPAINKSGTVDEIYDNLFPSMTIMNSNTDVAAQENTVIVNSTLVSPYSNSLPPVIGMPLNTNITQTEVDLYDGVGAVETEQSVKSVQQQPVSPLNTPTLNGFHCNPSSKGGIILPTLNANIDSIQMTDVIAKLNRVVSGDIESPFNNLKVIKPKIDENIQETKQNETAQSVVNTTINNSINPQNVDNVDINTMQQQQQEQQQEEKQIETNNNNNSNVLHITTDSQFAQYTTMNNLDEMTDVVVENDDDLFDYMNVKSPQELMPRYLDYNIMNEIERKQQNEYDNKYKVHKAAMSSNDIYTHSHCHQNQLSILSVASDVSQSQVPQQRPTTEKNIKTFFDTNTSRPSQHIQHVTLANINESNEFKRQISTTSQSSHLDLTDLQQHLNLLYILKSQGLMKNPEKLLHSHQKLNARRSQINFTNNFKKQRSTSQRDENKMKKYKKQKKIHSGHTNGIFCD